MQIVLCGEQSESDLKKVRDTEALRRHLLGIMWKDEPCIWSAGKMESDLQAFRTYRQQVRSILPQTPVFVNDGPGFVNGPEPAHWWNEWAIVGDVTAQDNYPIYSSTATIGSDASGLSESVSRAAHAVKQRKPVWAVLQAFEANTPEDKAWAWRFPTPVQMRAQIYTAIIHGATGIVYFAWDNHITREPDLVGFAPNARPDGYVSKKYSAFQAKASPEQIRKSAELYNAVAAANRELQELAPAILSPTIDPTDLAYDVEVTNQSVPNDPRKYSDTPIRTLLKRSPSGVFALLAVNKDDRTMDVAFNFTKNIGDVERLNESSNEDLAESGPKQRITCRFRPFQTHVFRFAVAKK